MGGSSPCASCKLLRRRCTNDCIFAPYFPSEDPHKFAIVHKVFGASNVSKMLQELPVQHRADAVSSLVYEANARARDPVYGCVGAISVLQSQVSQLQMQLAVAQAEILCIHMQHQQQQVDHHRALAAAALAALDSDEDDKKSSSSSSFFTMQNSLLVQQQPTPCELMLNYAGAPPSSNSANELLYSFEAFKKESSLYGNHDMIS